MVHPGRQTARTPRHPWRLTYSKILPSPVPFYAHLTGSTKLLCRGGGFLWNEGAGTRFFNNGISVCPFWVHRTIFRRLIHNIYSSCHVDVTYIIDKGPKSLEQWNLAPQGPYAEDEHEAWDCDTGFAWRAGGSRLFHHEQMGDPPRDADLLRCESR